MQVRRNWQAVAISVYALAIAARTVSATPQDQIVLIYDAQGRATYVNAAGPSDLTPATVKAVRMAPPFTPDPAVHNLISQTARTFEVDPELVDAVVRVESGYQTRARSPKGALGLMQLMPATAARFGVTNPFDPAENIRGGITYLGHLLRQFNGDVRLSLAAYNAGEGAVLREGGIPPFEETQKYVRKVTALYPTASSSGPGPVTGRCALVMQAQNRPRTADNAASSVPIYRYMDTQGVIHFSQ